MAGVQNMQKLGVQRAKLLGQQNEPRAFFSGKGGNIRKGGAHSY